MNILLTGGYGFIGLNLLELLLKEGHQVIVVDLRQPRNLSIKGHVEYLMDIKDDKCEEIFASHSIDVVIHLAELNPSDMASKRQLSANLVGLSRLLGLSSTYQVEKFLYLSTLDVYGALRPVDESGPLTPESNLGKWKRTQEEVLVKWGQDHDLNVKILRVGTVIGPHQEASEFEHIMTHLDQQTDVLYVRDLIYAINSLMTFSKSNVINLVSNYHDETGISFQRARSELYWKPKKTFEEVIRECKHWFEVASLNAHKPDNHPFITNLKSNRWFRRMMPFVENAATFGAFFVLDNFMKSKGISTDIDFLLIYILIMGLVYGLKQSTIATVVSVFYYIASVKSSGETLLSATYNVDTLLHISTFIFLGTVLGYMTDTQKLRQEEKDRETEEIKDKLNFVYDMYEDSKQERVRLHNQILSSNDSFGRIYGIIQKLEALSADRIYESSVEVIEEVLGVSDVHIYFMTQNKYFMRLISSSNQGRKVVKSVRIDDEPVVKQVVESREIFMNKRMDEHLPKVMIPIGNQDQLYAVIKIFDIQFESFNSYQINLIKVVANLITASIQRAYLYTQATESEQYVENSVIMKPTYFKALVEEKLFSNKKEVATLLMVDEKQTHMSLGEMSDYFSRQLRDFDQCGMVNEKLMVLLANTNEVEAGFAMKRFEQNEIITSIVQGEEWHALLT